jgi:hypothetical protein
MMSDRERNPNERAPRTRVMPEPEPPPHEDSTDYVYRERGGDGREVTDDNRQYNERDIRRETGAPEKSANVETGTDETTGDR